MRVALPILALAITASAASIQAQEPWTPELRPFVGTSIPTGGLRDVIGGGVLFGMEAAGEVRPGLHLLGTFGWAAGEARYIVRDRDVNVLQYDVGFEVNGRRPSSNGWQFHPFWGLGAGARTYLYESGALKDRTCASAYASGGIELQVGRTALRAEARDNVLCYRSPISDERAQTLNDLNVSLGLAYHFR